jgi:hypothetical protein
VMHALWMSLHNHLFIHTSKYHNIIKHLYMHLQNPKYTLSIIHTTNIGWLQSRTIVTIVELWLDWTTNSSTRLTSHIYYSSTCLFALVSTVSKWRWHMIEFKNMFIWIVNGCIYKSWGTFICHYVGSAKELF